MTQKTWLDESPYDWLERNLLWLGKTMLIGAVYDVLLAVAGFVFPRWVAQLIGMPDLVAIFGLYQWSMVHVVFACFCVLAWMDVKRNIVIVSGAVLARVIYAVLMLVLVLFVGAPVAWLILGGISLLLAAAHVVLLRMSDFGFWEVLLRAGNPPGFSNRTRMQERKEMRDQDRWGGQG